MTAALKTRGGSVPFAFFQTYPGLREIILETLFTCFGIGFNSHALGCGDRLALGPLLREPALPLQPEDDPLVVHAARRVHAVAIFIALLRVLVAVGVVLAVVNTFGLGQLLVRRRPPDWVGGGIRTGEGNLSLASGNRERLTYSTHTQQRS